MNQPLRLLAPALAAGLLAACGGAPSGDRPATASGPQAADAKASKPSPAHDGALRLTVYSGRSTKA